ncbi:hypothetical protein IIA16_05685 [bacterium]|nr:hypothetical protein [bacterium]
MEPAPGELFDFAMALRQPGSAVKPFVLAAGLEAGVTSPDEPVWDGPVAFWTGEEVWEPKNHDGDWAGMIGWVEAMAKSSNVVAAALADRVGMEGVAATFAALGIASPVRPYLSSALGTSEATLFEMVAAYGVIAADGVRHPPYFVEGRLTVDGSVFPVALAEAERALSPFTARAVISILGDALGRGTGARALSCDPGLPAIAGPCLLDFVPEAREPGPQGGPVRVFGKSGTSQNNRDGWFIGCVPSLCVGVWMGTPEGGGTLSGGHLPALAWNLFMRQAASHLTWTHFPSPPPILAAPTRPLGERARYNSTLP